MADINLTSNAQTAGIPAQWEQNINTNEQLLVTGDEPAIVTEDLVVATGTTFAALTPLAFDANGLVVPAAQGEPAIGIAIVGVNAATAGKGVPVYRAGVFNPRALTWPASYDTEAKQIAAFRGAPTPTNIIMRRPKTHSV